MNEVDVAMLRCCDGAAKFEFSPSDGQGEELPTTTRLSLSWPILHGKQADASNLDVRTHGS